LKADPNIGKTNVLKQRYVWSRKIQRILQVKPCASTISWKIESRCWA
jgi:hypothetical protein